jgi:hypothetical protein
MRCVAEIKLLSPSHLGVDPTPFTGADLGSRLIPELSIPPDDRMIHVGSANVT